MTRLAFAASLATGLAFAAAATAHAQPAPAEGPPGTCDCAAPAVVVAAAAPALPRWSIALGLSSVSITGKDGSADERDWGGAALELRYRLAPRWELGLEAGGAREKSADGSDGSDELRTATISARFHPRPFGRWDLYGVVALGEASIAPAAGDAPKPDRGVGELGVGLERRFGHIGIAAELRAIGVSASNARPSAASAPAMTTAATAGGTVMPAASDDGYTGGSLTIAASYEF